MCIVCMSIHHLCVCVLGVPESGVTNRCGAGCWELNSATPHFLCNGRCSTSSGCYTHCQVFLLTSLFNSGAPEMLQMAAPYLKHKTAAQRLGKQTLSGRRLPCKHQDQSSDPQHPRECRVGVAAPREGQGILGEAGYSDLSVSELWVQVRNTA